MRPQGAHLCAVTVSRSTSFEEHAFIVRRNVPTFHCLRNCFRVVILHDNPGKSSFKQFQVDLSACVIVRRRWRHMHSKLDASQCTVGSLHCLRLETHADNNNTAHHASPDTQALSTERCIFSACARRCRSMPAVCSGAKDGGRRTEDGARRTETGKRCNVATFQTSNECLSVCVGNVHRPSVMAYYPVQ